MIIVGAGGHAKEILDVFTDIKETEQLFFFDNVNPHCPEKLFGRFKIIKTFEEAKICFEHDKRFVLGIGQPKTRLMLSDTFSNIGGQLSSIISPRSFVSTYETNLANGLNVMAGVLISAGAEVGEGSLVNSYACIHHDAKVGRYTEVSPRANILGGASVGDLCSIGTGAVILPKIRVGHNVTVGAGAVVTKDIGDNCVVVGVPARLIRHLAPLMRQQ
jgi:sugar O-acyltransferase (sialic acid O-acetyltransferase NeuD family)